jgi:hypothetical protein
LCFLTTLFIRAAASATGRPVIASMAPQPSEVSDETLAEAIASGRLRERV